MDRVEHMDIRQIVLTAKPAVGAFLSIAPALGIVTGLVLRADELDADGDRLDAATIEKACYSWAENGGPGRKVLAEHDGKPLADVRFTQWGVAPATSPMTIYKAAGVTIPAGSWFAQLEVGAATLAKITSGKLNGFSVEGAAVIKRLDDDEEFEIDAGDLARAIVRGVVDGMGVRPATGEGGSRARRMFSRA